MYVAVPISSSPSSSFLFKRNPNQRKRQDKKETKGVIATRTSRLLTGATKFTIQGAQKSYFSPKKSGLDHRT
jgi:hypothetical protein